jgi:hypothetical protein
MVYWLDFLTLPGGSQDENLVFWTATTRLDAEGNGLRASWQPGRFRLR